MSIFVDFEDDDISDVVAPLLKQAAEARAAGEQGFVFAQVFDHSMRALFIEHKWAKEIQDVLRRRANALGTKATGSVQAPSHAAGPDDKDTGAT